jgi:hypothetical protein
MKEIPLTKGEVAIVDDQDYEWLMRYKWHAMHEGNICYAETTPRHGQNILMHKLILPVPDDMEVDHKNRNKLDNRRCNLRAATHRQNSFNQGKYKTVGGEALTSPFKGVSWDAEREKWRSTITIFKKQQMMGRFDNEHLAARIHDGMAQFLFGEFAVLNLPIAELPGC